MDYAIIRILHHCENWHKDLVIWRSAHLYANYQKDTYTCVWVHEFSGGAPLHFVPSCLLVENRNGTVLFSAAPSAVRSIKIGARVNIILTSK